MNPELTRPSGGTARKLLMALLALLIAAPLATITSMPALADENDPEYLEITKTVNPSDLTAGDQFTYRIRVTCSESNCINASISDSFPSELDGFPITGLSMTPDATSVPRTVTWGPDGTTERPARFGPDTRLDVLLAEETPDGAGLGSGTTFTISITTQVPDDYRPGTVTFTNTAATTADNALPVQDPADVTINVPRVIDVDVDKTWTPDRVTQIPGTESTIGLGITNASNGPVANLVLQEPSAATEGAPALDANNPFLLNDFAGFGDVSLPAGCDSVTVDAYVLTDGAWRWAAGSPATTPTLPVGVAAGDVGGLRISCTGAAIEEGAEGAYAINLTQRATDRNTGDTFEATTRTIDNTVVGEASVDGRDPVTGTDTATQTIVPVTVAAQTSKDITPSRIPAGDSASATITGTNASEVGVSELRVADLGYFTSDVTFGGFTAAPTWPEGATAAQFIYRPLDGSPAVTVSFDDGETPVVPDGVEISGFELVFTADGDGIVSGTGTSASFTINTDPDMAPDGAVGTDNTVTSTVTTASDRTANASDTDDLTVVTPEIVVNLDKSVLPSSAVEPGENVVTSLTSTTSAESEFVNPKTIVVEDTWGGETGEFWNAFDLNAVAPTQVLPDTSLEVKVQIGGAWVSVATFGSEADPRVVQVSQAEILAAIAPSTMDDVTGIQFTFTADDVFSSGTTVRPSFSSTARGELRNGDGATAEVGDPVTYENTATTTGTGETPGGQELTGADVDTGEATIKPEDGTGPVGIDKDWDQPTVDSQSSQRRTTTLSWEVDPGFETVTITDPSNPEAADNPQSTVFQAFDLVAVNGIDANDEPYTNGWWLKYDTITAVQLYDGDSWVTVAEPAGGWIDSSGAFAGYSLGGGERASTVGVRLVLEENTAAREAALPVAGTRTPPHRAAESAPAAGRGRSTSPGRCATSPARAGTS